jgi:Ca2+-binding EF-hand superfamily protein
MGRVQRKAQRASVEQVGVVREVFQQFDKDKSGSINKAEFAAAVEAAGIRLPRAQIANLYEDIDTNHNGGVDFSEFLDWYPTMLELVKKSRTQAVRDVDWDELRRQLPTAKTADEKRRRMELYNEFDPNKNGYLSLAEVDKGFRDVIKLPDIFDCKPVLMRAFQAARSLNDGRNKPSTHGPDYIEKCEFRLLLWYVRQYFEIWLMFDVVDSGDDRRVDYGEFVRAIPYLNEWGAKVKDPKAEFQSIDQNGGGQILFIEFADWALKKGLDLVEDDE